MGPLLSNWESIRVPSSGHQRELRSTGDHIGITDRRSFMTDHWRRMILLGPHNHVYGTGNLWNCGICFGFFQSRGQNITRRSLGMHIVGVMVTLESKNQRVLV